jgi:predicted alpha/beta-hydrolase family hydrolase
MDTALHIQRETSRENLPIAGVMPSLTSRGERGLHEVAAVPPDFLIDGPESAPRTIALAHGAGAGMDHPFLSFFAEGLADHGMRVVRFEFPYMASSRQKGRKGPPNPEPVLRQTWLSVIDKLDADGLVIGGKSMGGRIASMVADEAGVLGLVCLGYPFHPVGKPERLRVEHLTTMRTRALILQGERDPFGNRTEVTGYALSAAVQLAWLEGGDHDFKPRKTSGSTQAQNWEAALGAILKFVTSLSS